MPTPTERNSELIQALERKLAAAQEREATFRRDLESAQTLAEKQRGELTDLRRELAELRQETALLRQKIEDHLKRAETWDNRRWTVAVGLVMAVLGAALSLASGLIVTLARKQP